MKVKSDVDGKGSIGDGLESWNLNRKGYRCPQARGVIDVTESYPEGFSGTEPGS